MYFGVVQSRSRAITTLIKSTSPVFPCAPLLRRRSHSIHHSECRAHISMVGSETNGVYALFEKNPRGWLEDRVRELERTRKLGEAKLPSDMFLESKTALP